jgi:hypothetical protein
MGTSSQFKGKANLAASHNDAFVPWLGMEGCQMKEKALDLALEALERMNHADSIFAGEFDKEITAIKQARALDKKAENARELGLNYEPVQDVSLINEGKTAAPAQEPVGTYGEIHESMQALLRSGLQRDQQIYMAMKDKPLYATPPGGRQSEDCLTAAQRQWVDPNEKSQKQFLPHIGEPVLFCHDGVTYFGKHTGGSFTTGQGITTRNFNTWECHWMYPPSAKLKENT